ncbi:MAG: signal recognition particle receptor subunit alpha, partial [Planctomycetes bacterium]|nr:signal recognition particle receptor subunit alpha [Planctomycetota bacterium]
MFESITQRFSGILSRIARRKITENNIRETLREIRVALLEADVAFEVIKGFLARVEERALGEEVLKGVEPGQQFIHLVYREMANLMGPVDPRIPFQELGPTVILMAGLQGSGKTTTCAKLALLLRKKHKRKPLLVAADVQRPAAIDQL